MSALEIVSTMRRRVPWSVAGKIFRREDLHRGQGWDRTLSYVEDDDEGLYADKEEELAEALEEHFLSGEKIVRLYDLSEDDFETLKNELSDIQIDDGPFLDNYPAFVSDEELVVLQNNDPSVLAVEEYDNGTAVLMTSVRYQTTREVFEAGEIPQQIVDEFGEFNEIIGVRIQRHQAIDVLWVPDEYGPIELRVDHAFGTPFQRGVAALDQAEQIIGERISIDPFGSQKNLYPAICGLYDAVGEGLVIELAFMVAGSAQKLERTRRGRLCCRVEAYHVAGKLALADPVEPYLIAVLWNRFVTQDINSYPEVAIRGTSIMTGQENPFVGEMVVRNCVGAEDFDHVVDRVLNQI